MPSELFEKGLVVRKEVLGEGVRGEIDQGRRRIRAGDAGVRDRGGVGLDLDAPGLPRKTRSLLNIAMLTIMNRQHELKLHIRSSFTNGVTKDEIKEVLLQVAAVCGRAGGHRRFPSRARSVCRNGCRKKVRLPEGSRMMGLQ